MTDTHRSPPIEKVEFFSIKSFSPEVISFCVFLSLGMLRAAALSQPEQGSAVRIHIDAHIFLFGVATALGLAATSGSNDHGLWALP